MRISLEFGAALTYYEQGEVESKEDGSYDECIQAIFFRIDPAALEVGSPEDGLWLNNIELPATPDGLRQLIRIVRPAVRTLREKGLCPRCPDGASAAMRSPGVEYCAECCLQVAVLGSTPPICSPA